MTQERLDAAAQRVYETLATRGHGPRPWVQHGALTPPWEQVSEQVKDDYRAAVRAVMEVGVQEVMTLDRAALPDRVREGDW